MSHAKMVNHNLSLNSTTTLRHQKVLSGGRSTVACGSCRLRKVRCNYSTPGIPCSNCQYDGVTCEILPRRKIGAKRKHIWGHSNLLKSVEVQQSSSKSDRAASPGSIGILMGESPISPCHDQPAIHQETVAQATALSPRPAADSNTEFSIAFHTQASPQPGDNRDLLYFGDQQGMNGMLLDLPTGSPQSSRCFAPVRLKRSLPAEDLEFLRLKGCFTFPPQRICDALITFYFQLVHPFIPVINSVEFLQNLDDGSYVNASLLVLWSVFFTASSFIDANLIREAGYETRKEMKLAMYRKAKYLFDNNFEEDKIAVVQSAVLLSYFYTETDDRFGSWHWLGTAISLCQTLGLHRRLETFAPENHFTTDKLRLFRRIWWTCFIRDRWLSLGQGRPMRIDIDFCDAAFPKAEDVTLDLRDLPTSIREKYLSADQTKLARLWIKLVNLSQVVGNTIQTLYGFQRSLPAIEDVMKYEAEILQLDSGPVGFDTDPTTAFHIYVLQMFQGAAIIVLYRPYLKYRTDYAAHVTEPSLRALSRTKVKAAASQINNILERVLDMDGVRWLQPIWLTAIMPAMQIHLIEMIQGSSPLLRRISSQRLQLCMMVLADLRDNYWGADAIYRLFEQAEVAMCNRPEQRHLDNPTVVTGLDSTRPSNSRNQGSNDDPLPALQSQSYESQHSSVASLNWFDPDGSFLDQSAFSFLLDFGGPDIFGTIAPSVEEGVEAQAATADR